LGADKGEFIWPQKQKKVQRRKLGLRPQSGLARKAGNSYPLRFAKRKEEGKEKKY